MNWLYELFATGRFPIEPVPPIPPRVFSAPDGHKRLTMNIPIELHAKLKTMAAAQDKTMTDIVLAIVEAQVK